MATKWIIYGIAHHINQRKIEVWVSHERVETVWQHDRHAETLEDAAVVFIQTKLRHLRSSAEPGTFQGILWKNPETGEYVMTTEDEYALAPLEAVKAQWEKELRIKAGVFRVMRQKTWRSKHKAGMVRVWKRKEYRETRSKIMQDYWANPENRDSMSRKVKGAQKFRWANPDLRKRLVGRIQERWKDPEFKRRSLQVMQEGKARKRAAKGRP